MSTLRNEKCPPPHHFFPLLFLHISRPLTKKSDPTSWIDPSPPFLLPPPPPSCLRSGRGGGGGIKNRRSCKGEPPLNFPELSRLRSSKGGVPPTAVPMSTPPPPSKRNQSGHRRGKGARRKKFRTLRFLHQMLQTASFYYVSHITTGRDIRYFFIFFPSLEK